MTNEHYNHFEDDDETEALLSEEYTHSVEKKNTSHIQPQPPHVTVYNLLDEANLELGVGKFHYILILVCSYGFFVDSAESTLIGIIYPILMEEFDVDQSKIALVGSLTSVGMLTGAIFFGRFSDLYGRKHSFIISINICFICSFLSSYAPDISSFTVVRMILGFGYGGNIITCSTLLIEFLPQDTRGFYSTLSGSAFGLGALLVSSIGYFIVPTLGWRWLVRIAALLGVPVLGLLLFVPESPRFLLMRGEYDKVIQVMQLVAKTNRKTLPEWFNCDRPSVLRKLVPLSLIWFFDSFASVFYTWIPLEAKHRFPSQENVVYLIAIVSSFGLLAGCLCQLLVVMRFGRLIQLRVGLILSVAATIIIGYAKTPIGLYVAAFFGVFLQQIVGGILYLYTPESFSTKVRVTAFGICQTGHRLAPIVAPALLSFMYPFGFAETSYVFSSIYAFGFILTLFLTYEPFNKALVENI